MPIMPVGKINFGAPKQVPTQTTNAANIQNNPNQAAVISTSFNPYDLTSELKNIQKNNDVFLGGNLDLKSKSGIMTDVLAQKTAEQIAKEAAAAAENSAVQSVVDSFIQSGVPLTSIKPEMLLGNSVIQKVGIDNVSKIQNILDGYKKNKQDSAKMMATSGINEIIKFADKIPSSSGVFGLHLQGPWNAVRGTYNEDIASASKNLDANIDSTLASLAKAFGEVGNLSQFDQESYRKILNLIADPNVKVRKDARQSLQNRLTKDIGFDITVSDPLTLKMNEKKNVETQQSWQPPSDFNVIKEKSTGKIFYKSPDGKIFNDKGELYGGQ